MSVESNELFDELAIKALKKIGIKKNQPDYFFKILDVFSEQAVEVFSKIETAIEDEDIPAIRQHAHLLKGSANSVGAQSLAKHFDGLQKFAEQKPDHFCTEEAKEIYKNAHRSFLNSIFYLQKEDLFQC